MRPPRFIRLRIAVSGLILVTFSSIIYAITYKFKETIFLQGQIISTTPSAFLRSPIEAKLIRILVSTNQIVKKDDLLLEFDCTSLNRTLLDATSRVSFLEKAVVLSQKNNSNQLESNSLKVKALEEYVKTYSELAAYGAVSQLQLKDYEQKLAQALLQAQRTESEYTQNKLRLETQTSTAKKELMEAKSSANSCKIFSPIDGVISDVAVKPQELVPKGASLMRIYNPSSQAMIFNLTPSNLPFVKVNSKFDVRVPAYPFNRYGSMTATIESISPLTKNMIDDNSASSSNSPSGGQQNIFMARGVINKLLNEPENLPPPILKDGMPVTGLFTSTDKRLIYIFSDQFVKIQNSIRSMRSRF